MRAIAKGTASERPPASRRRYTVRNSAGTPLGNGATPDEAIRRGSKHDEVAWIEERDRSYPFRVWHRVRLGARP